MVYQSSIVQFGEHKLVFKDLAFDWLIKITFLDLKSYQWVDVAWNNQPGLPIFIVDSTGLYWMET